jgi:hypothetical protein
MAAAKTYSVTYKPAPSSPERTMHAQLEITEYYTAANPMFAVKKAQDERGDKIEILRVIEVPGD